MKKMTTKTSGANRILKILMEADGPVTAGTLKKKAKINDYDSVPKRIRDLREEGYDITTVTRKGMDGARATTYQL